MQITSQSAASQPVVDGIIEKVLEAGGDVELVKPGTLAGYEPIVLIERYTSSLHS